MVTTRLDGMIGLGMSALLSLCQHTIASKRNYIDCRRGMRWPSCVQSIYREEQHNTDQQETYQ